MKKILVILSLSLVSLSAFAQLQPIPQEKLKAYEQAVDMAMPAHSFNCMLTFGSDSFSMEDVIDNATYGELDSSGAQPELVFTSLAADGTSKSIVSVTTSADYKSLVSLDGATYVKVEENVGDLENPVIVPVFKLSSSATCKATN